MNKILRAIKVKDGWYVIISRRDLELTKSDVLKRIRYEGLKINKKLSDEDLIYAD